MGSLIDEFYWVTVTLNLQYLNSRMNFKKKKNNEPFQPAMVDLADFSANGFPFLYGTLIVLLKGDGTKCDRAGSGSFAGRVLKKSKMPKVARREITGHSEGKVWQSSCEIPAAFLEAWKHKERNFFDSWGN